MNRLERFVTSVPFALGLSACTTVTDHQQTSHPEQVVQCGPKNWEVVQIPLNATREDIIRLIDSLDLRLVTLKEATKAGSEYIPTYSVAVDAHNVRTGDEEIHFFGSSLEGVGTKIKDKEHQHSFFWEIDHNDALASHRNCLAQE